MPTRKPRYFRVIYYDRDALKIGISEIITDDTAVTERTCQLKNAGKNVNISTTGPEKDIRKVPSIDDLVRNLLPGYTYDPSVRW